MVSSGMSGLIRLHVGSLPEVTVTFQATKETECFELPTFEIRLSSELQNLYLLKNRTLWMLELVFASLFFEARPLCWEGQACLELTVLFLLPQPEIWDCRHMCIRVHMCMCPCEYVGGPVF